MRNNIAKKTALGGLLAALAVVIMCIGGLFAVATFVCVVLCMLLCNVVYRICGRRFAWAWYGAVSILSLLLGSDKEAAALFVFVGYYPIFKSFFDRKKVLGFLGKVIYFNAVILATYFILIHLFGMVAIMTEFTELGIIGGVVMLILGNVTFLFLDRLLMILNKMRG